MERSKILNIEIIGKYVKVVFVKMKKAFLTTLIVLSISGTVMAAPLTDYSHGKASIDVSYMPSLDLSVDGLSTDGKSKNSDFGITYGLGNKLAIQYVRNSVKTDTTYLTSSIFFRDDVTVQQANILYKIGDNSSAFVGFTQGKDNLVTSGGTIDGKNVNGYQVGLQEIIPINEKLSSYGIVSIGNKITNYEIGLTQKIVPNLELNVFYKSMKYKDLEYKDIPGFTFDGKAEGLGIGATFKF